VQARAPHPTPILKSVIGFMYLYGQENEIEGSQSEQDKPDKVSMDELAEWTGRSKATIKEYCDKTLDAWHTVKEELLQEKLRSKAHDIALRELVEEEKKKILAEKTDLAEHTQETLRRGI